MSIPGYTSLINLLNLTFSFEVYESVTRITVETPQREIIHETNTWFEAKIYAIKTGQHFCPTSLQTTGENGGSRTPPTRAIIAHCTPLQKYAVYFFLYSNTHPSSTSSCSMHTNELSSLLPFFFFFPRFIAFSSLLHTSETRKEFRFELLIADVRVLRKGIGFRLGRQSSRLCFQSTAICGVRSRSHSADEEKVARLERPESKMVSLTAILIYSDIYTRIYPAGDKWLDVCNCKRRRKNNF